MPAKRSISNPSGANPPLSPPLSWIAASCNIFSVIEQVGGLSPVVSSTPPLFVSRASWFGRRPLQYHGVGQILRYGQAMNFASFPCASRGSTTESTAGRAFEHVFDANPVEVAADAEPPAKAGNGPAQAARTSSREVFIIGADERDTFIVPALQKVCGRRRCGGGRRDRGGFRCLRNRVRRAVRGRRGVVRSHVRE